MKNCKACGKELIGKEKFFCNSCWSKGKDKTIKGVMAVGGIASLAILFVANKGKISDVIKGISKDA